MSRRTGSRQPAVSRRAEVPADRRWVRLIMPRDNVSAPFTAEQLYAAIHAGLRPDELVQLLLTGHSAAGNAAEGSTAAGHTSVDWWLRAGAAVLGPLLSQLQSAYPDLQVTPGDPPLPARGLDRYLGGQRWTLAADRAYPMKRVQAFVNSDPMAMTLGALAQAGPGETGALSVVLGRAPASFARHAATYAQALATGADTSSWGMRLISVPFELLASILTGLISAADPPHNPYPAQSGRRQLAPMSHIGWRRSPIRRRSRRSGSPFAPAGGRRRRPGPRPGTAGWPAPLASSRSPGRTRCCRPGSGRSRCGPAS